MCTALAQHGLRFQWTRGSLRGLIDLALLFLRKCIAHECLACFQLSSCVSSGWVGKLNTYFNCKGRGMNMHGFYRVGGPGDLVKQYFSQPNGSLFASF